MQRNPTRYGMKQGALTVEWCHRLFDDVGATLNGPAIGAFADIIANPAAISVELLVIPPPHQAPMIFPFTATDGRGKPLRDAPMIHLMSRVGLFDVVYCGDGKDAKGSETSLIDPVHKVERDQTVALITHIHEKPVQSARDIGFAVNAHEIPGFDVVYYAGETNRRKRQRTAQPSRSAPQGRRATA